VPSSPAQFRSLEAGEFDLAMTSPDNVLAYRFLSANPLGRNLDVGVLAAIDRGLGLSLCISPQLDGIESVRGQVVGVDVPQSGFAFVAFALLEKHGLAPGDYQVAAIGSTPGRASALIAGDCAATVLNAGNELRAAGAGCGTVARVSELGPYLGTVLAEMKTGDKAHNAARLRFADVVLQTAQEIHAGQWESEVIEAARALLGLTAEEAQAHHACLLDPQTGLVIDGIVDRESLSTLIELRKTYMPSAQLDTIPVESFVIERALGASAEPTSD
jgi:ABC-type nitrate/sulfonate/bicarbonate transport system substrate-binding protein